MSINLTVPISELTADQAGTLIDAIDRSAIKADAETYDDLLLVASGHAELLRDADERKRWSRPRATCVVCLKPFDALRPTVAKYCGPACRGKAARRAARSHPADPGPSA